MRYLYFGFGVIGAIACAAVSFYGDEDFMYDLYNFYEDKREDLKKVVQGLIAALIVVLCVLLVKVVNRVQKKRLRYTQPVAEIPWEDRKKITTKYFVSKLKSTEEYKAFENKASKLPPVHLKKEDKIVFSDEEDDEVDKI